MKMSPGRRHFSVLLLAFFVSCEGHPPLQPPRQSGAQTRETSPNEGQTTNTRDRPMRTARTIADGVGYYHVILKATGPQFLFREDADKAAFQDILKRVSRFSSVQPLAYAFLDNHMHLLLKVPERESVPDDDFARRVTALYGPDRAAALFARWEKWRAQGREAEAERQRDGLLRRMFDLGQFMKTVKEMFHVRYSKAHGWEGTLWRGRYKSLLVCESFAAFKALSLYIALNPVRAGIAKRGTDSKWTSYGQARRGVGFGAECHGALLRELARLAGTTQDGSAAFAERFGKWMAESEAVPAETAKEALSRGESLSLPQMLVCRIQAFGNGRAVGLMRQVAPLARRGGPQPIGRCGLFTATRVRGPLRLTA